MFLIPLVVLVVVLAILFRPEEGLFDKVKGLILGAKDILPTVSVGLEEQKAEVTVPDIHEAEILELGNTLQGMLGSGKENCFANYGGVSEIGEAATSLRFELRGDKTLLTVYGGAGGKQVITKLSVDFPGMKPCVIAGAGGVSENFFKHFIEGEKLTYPYFSPVNSLALLSSSNDINIPDINLVNDLEENGWLFTPDGKHICFFPTNTVADYDDEGIDNDYFTIAEENSIQNRINAGKLQRCS
ncbi:MAG: hypothetical protein AABY40_01750 [Nanoarchaeota archaeon]